MRKTNLILSSLVIFGLTLSTGLMALDRVVTNTGNSGAGSLRQAIADVGAAGGVGTITFNLTLPATISLTSQLLNNDAVTMTITGPGADQLSIDGQKQSRVFNFGANPTVTITGLTIKNGKGVNGGGIYNYTTGAALTLENCTISGNEANLGGGIYNDYSNMVLTNCTISGNSADYGGGMYNAGGGSAHYANPTLTNCTISGNSASGAGNGGGGMYNDGSDSGGSNPELTNCTISGNSADRGGGMYNNGNTAGTSSPILQNCTISENTASQYGGGIYNYGNSGTSSPIVTNCTISGNHADYGGGVYGSTSSSTLTNCTISGNHANNYGGGISADDCELPGISSSTLTNCTISGNEADLGGGIYNGLYGSTCNLTIKNTILADNLAADTDGHDFYYNGAGIVTDNGYNIVEYSYGYAWVGTGDITGDQADLNLRSTLADNGTSNGTQTLALYYNGTTASVAIDAGGDGNNGVTGVAVPATDQRGAGRYDSSEPNVQSSIDIGAYEDWYGDDNALPVELTFFIAEASNEEIVCKWTTESETENLGFILERKTEGSDWSEIASYKTDNGLMGQGTTSSYTNYEYLDKFVEPNTAYEYRLADVDYNGVVTYHASRNVTAGNTPQSGKVEKFTVLPAYPNPFNPSTTITYGIETDNKVTIDIYDITGQLINTLQNGYQIQGWHSVIWNGTNRDNELVPAGIYLSKITSNNTTKTTKLMLLK